MASILRGALALVFLAATAEMATAQVAIDEENTNIGTASAEFLTLGAGARGMALGGSFSALVRDVEALYYNPAGLALMEGGVQAMVTVMPYFAGTDYYWVGLAFPWADQFAIGVNLGNFGFDDQQIFTEDDPDGLSGETYSVSETFVGLTFAHAFIDRFTGGVSLKFISDNLGDVSGSAFAVDIGTNFHTELGGKPVAMAVMIQNLGSQIDHSGSGLDFTAFPGDPNDPNDPSANLDPAPARFRSQSFPLPTTFRVGLAYDVVSSEASRLSLLGEFNETNNTDPSWSFAGEYEWDQPTGRLAAALRLSYSYQPDNYLSSGEEAQFAGSIAVDDRGLDGLALGGGLRYRFAQYEGRLDYAYRHFGVLGHVDVFTLGFSLR